MATESSYLAWKLLIYDCNNLVFIIRYSQFQTSIHGNIRSPRDREYIIWTYIKGCNERDLATYQPEIDGYEVSSVRQGMNFLVVLIP